MLFNILHSIRKARNYHRFKKLCCIEDFFSCTSSSNCFNESGRPEAIKIAAHVEIAGILTVYGNGYIKIGPYSTVRYNSSIESIIGVEIGQFVIISNNVLITDNNNHPTCPYKRIEMLKSGFYGDRWHWRYAECKPVRIHDNVWIGRHATILKGVTIGEGSIVACNAVVTREVPPYTVVAGNPAKIVKQLTNYKTL